jgi:hypothetical protein
MGGLAEGFDLDEARGRVTDALIRLPNHPRRDASLRWRDAVGRHPSIASWSNENPVVGVATTTPDDPEVVVLLARELDFDPEAIRSAFDLRYPVRALQTGPIVPAARPAQGGDSISGDGLGGDTGTLGCVVKAPADDLFVLGCNHTLAGVNRATVNQDTVRQPGADDGGLAPAHTLGKLVSYRTILLGGYHSNTIDAAIAEPDDPADIAPGVRGIGAITGVGVPLRYGDRLHKVGWKTGYTAGTHRYMISYQTEFPGVGPALFVDQYGIVGDDPAVGFAQRGDSGAAVLTEGSDELIGMVIGVAEGENLVLVSPIDPVLAAFGVEPV